MDWISEIAAELSAEKMSEEYRNMSEDFQMVADAIGMEFALRLAKELGGMQIYIPQFDKLIRKRRDLRIRAEFTGFNHRKLAKKYNLTDRWIREIVQVGLDV